MTERALGRDPWLAVLHGLRPHHWAKNLIVFAPLLLAGKERDQSLWLAAAGALLAVCLAASAGYFVNDLIDLADDRRHTFKSRRPLAAGHLRAPQALAAALALGAAGLVVGFVVSAPAGVAILAYLALGSLYSFGLKRLIIVDCAALALLFLLRVCIGGLATAVPLSSWLVALTLALFFSLALAKRLDELVERRARLERRGYRPGHAGMIGAVGGASALFAVATLILYVAAGGYPADFYVVDRWLWAFPIVVGALLLRVWTHAARGRLAGDPVLFALRDPTCLLAGAGLCTAFGLARGGVW